MPSGANSLEASGGSQAAGGATNDPAENGPGGSTPVDTGGAAATNGASGSSAMPPAAVPEFAVSIDWLGNGTFGFVSSSPPGIFCSGAPCVATFPEGTELVLTAQTDSLGGSGFAGWGGACSGLDTCSFVVTSDTDLSVTYERANVVFVTSTASTGNYGGLAGADAICNERARAGGHSGEFRAWLSIESANAIDRLRGSRGWVRPDQKPVVDQLQDFASGAMFYPIRIDEASRDVGVQRVRTGTISSGRLAPNGVTCADYTAEELGSVADGRSSGVGTSFTSFGSSACAAERPLYCFGVGRSVAIRPRPTGSTRLGFVSGYHFPGAGLADADAFCQGAARDSDLAGTFKAVLATSTQSAQSRFDLSGPPWARFDGIVIARTAADFFEASLWDTAPLPLPGSGLLDGSAVWGGGTSLTTPGTLEDTCNDWTSVTGVGSAGRMGMTAANEFFYFDPDTSCDFNLGLLCLED